MANRKLAALVEELPEEPGAHAQAASAHEPEISDEMVNAACEAFEQAQQWLVAPARAYPVREVTRRTLQAAFIACEKDGACGCG